MFDYTIIKINRHLFENETSEINRVLRSFVSRGANPRCSGSKVRKNTVNEKEKNRAEMLNLKLSLQDKRYRLNKLFKLNLPSLNFGVLSPFN